MLDPSSTPNSQLTSGVHSDAQNIFPHIFPNSIGDMQEAEVPAHAGNDTHLREDQDTSSGTSTIRHSHEPFITFQHKVTDLIAKHFHQDLSEIKVERMKGGSYNRVIGVTISPKPRKYSLAWFKAQCLGAQRKADSKRAESYIVRIPRQNGDDMDRNVAILKVVGSQLTLPTPEVVSYDLSSNNVFDKPYMIQKRLPGHNLAKLWITLNLEQKKCIAKRVTELVSSIASVEAPAGDVALTNLSQATHGPLRVDKFCVPARGLEDESFDKPNTWPAQAQKPVDHLLEQCERWREYQTSQDACFDEIWDGFVAISKALEAKGFLDGSCVLAHGDLKAYNLLAEVRSATDVDITGVLDWDYAVVAPELLAYRAPFWLWVPEDMDSANEDDERYAILEPSTDEDRELKQVFLEHASKKYKSLALASEAFLARRMFPILQKGIFGPWNMLEAENIIREWDELHPEDGVATIDTDSDDSSDVSLS